jgi:hypothetical protein
MTHTIFCCLVWGIVFSYIFWQIIETSQQAIAHLKRLHQIPCSRCIFFTGDYRLKCTVHPLCALSEEAINCRDFELRENHPLNTIYYQSVKHNSKK